MPMVSRISPVKAQNPIVGLMTAANNKVAKTASKEVLKDTLLTPAQFKKMVSEQKFEVSQGMAQTRKGTPLDMHSPTLYLICW